MNQDTFNQANVNNPEFDFSILDNNPQPTTNVTELPIWGLPKRCNFTFRRCLETSWLWCVLVVCDYNVYAGGWVR